MSKVVQIFGREDFLYLLADDGEVWLRPTPTGNWTQVLLPKKLDPVLQYATDIRPQPGLNNAPGHNNPTLSTRKDIA